MIMIVCTPYFTPSSSAVPIYSFFPPLFPLLPESCVLMADGASLGAPACTASQNIYLKTVYTCVQGQVLKDHYKNKGMEVTAPPTTSTTSTTTPGPGRRFRYLS